MRKAYGKNILLHQNQLMEKVLLLKIKIRVSHYCDLAREKCEAIECNR